MIGRLLAASLRSKSTTLLALGAVLLANALLLIVLRSALTYDSERVLRVNRALGLPRVMDIMVRGPLGQDSLEAMGKLPQVSHVEPFAVLPAALEGEPTHIVVLPPASPVWNLEDALLEGESPNEPGTFALSASEAGRLGLRLGDRVSWGIMLGESDETAQACGVSLQLSGIFRDGAPVPNIPVTTETSLGYDFATAAPNGASLLLRKGLEAAEADAVAASVEQMLPGLRVRSFVSTYVEEQRQRTQVATILGQHFALLTAAVGLLVWTVASMQVRRSRRQIGTLIALGLAPRCLLLVGALEAAILSGGACLLALAISPAVIDLLHHFDVFCSLDASAVILSLGAILPATVLGWIIPYAAALNCLPQSLIRDAG